MENCEYRIIWVNYVDEIITSNGIDHIVTMVMEEITNGLLKRINFRTLNNHGSFIVYYDESTESAMTLGSAMTLKGRRDDGYIVLTQQHVFLAQDNKSFLSPPMFKSSLGDRVFRIDMEQMIHVDIIRNTHDGNDLLRIIRTQLQNGYHYKDFSLEYGVNIALRNIAYFLKKFKPELLERCPADIMLMMI